jgi:hypothetical protein
MKRTVTVSFDIDTDDYNEPDVFETEADLLPLVEGMLDGDADLPERAQVTIGAFKGLWTRNY